VYATAPLQHGTLAPATRWGYFVYPIGLLGWLVLTRPPSVGAAAPGGPVRRGIASRGIASRGIASRGIASLGVPAAAGKPTVSASAR